MVKALMLGSDINVYYMSRCYHELYGKNAKTIKRTIFSIYLIFNRSDFFEQYSLNILPYSCLNQYFPSSNFENLPTTP